jgi:hypothetical protein
MTPGSKETFVFLLDDDLNYDVQLAIGGTNGWSLTAYQTHMYTSHEMIQERKLVEWHECG